MIINIKVLKNNVINKINKKKGERNVFPPATLPWLECCIYDNTVSSGLVSHSPFSCLSPKQNNLNVS